MSGVHANLAGLPVHIFRLPGIYGPGRGPLTKIQEGSARRIAKVGGEAAALSLLSFVRTIRRDREATTHAAHEW